VLALVNDPERRPEPYRIAAEIRDLRNAEVARVVGGQELQLVLADDLISRIVVHSSRQAGLSGVYSELLDFDGCEIYTAEQPELVGKSFDEAVMAYEKCSLIGLCDRKGRVYLNPPGQLIIRKGIKAIIIAEDDDAIQSNPAKAGFEAQAIREPKTVPIGSERTLIVGWNRRGPIIARELSRYVAAGSLLTIAADTPDIAADVAGLALPSDKLEVELKRTDTTSRAALDALDVLSYDHVLVLGYSDTLPPQPADTRTLIALLHLRKIAEASGRHISVVSEMIDVRNRELAEVTRADDFVVSNKLVSLMLAQASENEYLSAIFDDLLDEKGSEFYMRPVADYLAIDRPVNFYTVAEAARRRGEIAIGYRRTQRDGGNGRGLGGVTVNPVKSEAVQYQPADRIIVLARD
jgi:voltage-gated potassium channel Kch